MVGVPTHFFTNTFFVHYDTRSTEVNINRVILSLLKIVKRDITQISKH